jgi:hypothetical protein
MQFWQIAYIRYGAIDRKKNFFVRIGTPHRMRPVAEQTAGLTDNFPGRDTNTG